MTMKLALYFDRRWVCGSWPQPPRQQVRQRDACFLYTLRVKPCNLRATQITKGRNCFLHQCDISSTSHPQETKLSSRQAEASTANQVKMLYNRKRHLFDMVSCPQLMPTYSFLSNLPINPSRSFRVHQIIRTHWRSWDIPTLSSVAFRNISSSHHICTCTTETIEKNRYFNCHAWCNSLFNSLIRLETVEKYRHLLKILISPFYSIPHATSFLLWIIQCFETEGENWHFHQKCRKA